MLFIAELIDRWQQHRKKVSKLLDADEAREDQRERLRKKQSKIIDYNLSERLVDFELVKEEIKLIRKNLFNSIKYEEDSIAKKEQIIEANKQLLRETFKQIRWVDDDEETNKETETL